GGEWEDGLARRAGRQAWGEVGRGRAADRPPPALHRGEDRRVRGLDHRDVALGVKIPLLEEIPGDRIRRAAEAAGGDRLALHEAGEIAAVRREALFGAEIDVAAVDAVHDGAH